MTIFDIDEIQGSWFDLDDGGRVQLKTISYEEWKEIDKDTTKKGSPEYPKLNGKHERFQLDIIDQEARMEMIYDKTIIAWEGIYDKNEKPIPCTKEWKLKLLTMKSPHFRNFYSEKMKILMDAEAGEVEKSEKN